MSKKKKLLYKELIEITKDEKTAKRMLNKIYNSSDVVICKDCKYFHLNYFDEQIGLITAHEICKFWGNGCKTDENGFCSFGELKESDEE